MSWFNKPENGENGENDEHEDDEDSDGISYKALLAERDKEIERLRAQVELHTKFLHEAIMKLIDKAGSGGSVSLSPAGRLAQQLAAGKASELSPKELSRGITDGKAKRNEDMTKGPVGTIPG